MAEAVVGEVVAEGVVDVELDVVDVEPDVVDVEPDVVDVKLDVIDVELDVVDVELDVVGGVVVGVMFGSVGTPGGGAIHKGFMHTTTWYTTVPSTNVYLTVSFGPTIPGIVATT